MSLSTSALTDSVYFFVSAFRLSNALWPSALVCVPAFTDYFLTAPERGALPLLALDELKALTTLIGSSYSSTAVPVSEV